ncbi:MBL fold metallo-hydrolase [Microbacter margulisiae]|uniref:Glyoxylase-like metal-dependent hydrolase (Beta-lactamase superfamily II) n=1 Tax=Microbacter margulisiae TaxID=1350067 RepID=A0A7W5DNT0_9PORP|nr:MBL fold metallo-hydrolase [Microbacter margulisiae]MBB3185963.1 glyoxylase-like metal-dependent hydrolase (beta-lactamase superfamily II) [Microbacter margulisiae]
MEAIRRNNMEVHQIINSVYQSNTYILFDHDSRHCWLIDCGDSYQVEAWLKENNKTVAGVLLTHTHFDHIYGLNTLKDQYPHIHVFTSENGAVSLYEPKYNFSRYHHTEFIYQSNDVAILKEHDVVELFPNHTLHVMETKGHDWSCLTYQVNQHLFTGDAYIPGLKVVATFPKSNKQEAEKSLTRILHTIQSDTTVCAGHGPIIVPIDDRTNNA